MVFFKKPVESYPHNMAGLAGVINHIVIDPNVYDGPAMDLITWDPHQLATILQPFISAGSRRYRVTVADLSISKRASVAIPNPVTFSFLIAQGNKFFDCLFYLSLTPANRPQILDVPDAQVDAALTATAISGALFYQFFFLLTRGAVSHSATVNLGQDVSNFLYNVMNLKEAPAVYAARLASFDLAKIDPSWVKASDFRAVAREANSRFGLGLAGYRLFQIFKKYTPSQQLTQALQDAVAWARSVATTPMSWEIHSATRDPNILTRFGNLNKNLTNLILDVYTPAEIQDMLATKALPVPPIRQAGHTEYLSWSGPFIPNPAEQIFP